MSQGEFDPVNLYRFWSHGVDDNSGVQMRHLVFLSSFQEYPCSVDNVKIICKSSLTSPIFVLIVPELQMTLTS
jgi:hypothetical protein